jgi:RNA polymerase sigma-70 factor (ECF subfamily)
MSEQPLSQWHTQPSLLVRLRNRADDAAWKLFLEVYTPLIYRYCRKHHLQEADAAEVVQDVLFQVNRSITSFEYNPERGRFRNWLGSVVRSKLSRFFRSNPIAMKQDSHEMIHLTTNHSDSDWSDHFHSELLQTALNRIQEEFEPHTWQAFDKVWLQQKTAAHAAKELSMTVAMVYVAKSRVLKRLQTEILMLADDIPNLPPRLDPQQ